MLRLHPQGFEQLTATLHCFELLLEGRTRASVGARPANWLHTHATEAAGIVFWTRTRRIARVKTLTCRPWFQEYDPLTVATRDRVELACWCVGVRDNCVPVRVQHSRAYCSSNHACAVQVTSAAVGVRNAIPFEAVAGQINSLPGAGTHRKVARWLRPTLARIALAVSVGSAL